MMHIHFLLFTLYLISGLGLQIAMNLFYVTGKSQQLFLVMMIVCMCLDCGVSLTQAFIFS